MGKVLGEYWLYSCMPDFVGVAKKQSGYCCMFCDHCWNVGKANQIVRLLCVFYDDETNNFNYILLDSFFKMKGRICFFAISHTV